MEYYSLINENTYNTTYGEIATDKILIKKSEFISYVFNINSNIEAIKYIDEVRNNNKSARHVVYIYSYLQNGQLKISYNDDGEPQGTGTGSILKLLETKKLTNICIVIVRYFGGILLGAGPLSRAYLNSCKDVINNLKLEEIIEYNYLEFECTYKQYDLIINLIENYTVKKDIILEDSIFNENIKVVLKINKNKYSKIVSLLEKSIDKRLF